MAKVKKPGRQVHPHLTILEDISTLIAHSHDLQDTLQNIVTTVRDRVEAEVCSIYILDPQKKRLTLRATMGLDQESIGKVSMAIDEGDRAYGAGHGCRRTQAPALQIFS